MAVVPNTSIVLPLIEHANLQVAMNALQADASTWELIGMAGDLGNYGGVSLPGLVAGQWHGPGEAARQYVARKVGPDETLPCLRAGWCSPSSPAGRSRSSRTSPNAAAPSSSSRWSGWTTPTSSRSSSACGR